MAFEQRIQSRLTAHGYATGGIDGVIGTATIAATSSMLTPTRWKRNFWTNAKPNRVKVELDFRKATRVGLIVWRVGERKTKFKGVTCTPLEKSHGLRKAFTADGMVTAASVEKYEHVLQHFK